MTTQNAPPQPESLTGFTSSALLNPDFVFDIIKANPGCSFAQIIANGNYQQCEHSQLYAVLEGLVSAARIRRWPSRWPSDQLHGITLYHALPDVKVGDTTGEPPRNVPFDPPAGVKPDEPLYHLANGSVVTGPRAVNLYEDELARNRAHQEEWIALTKKIEELTAENIRLKKEFEHEINRLNAHWLNLHFGLYNLRNAVILFARGVIKSPHKPTEPRVIGFEREFQALVQENAKPMPLLDSEPNALNGLTKALGDAKNSLIGMMRNCEGSLYSIASRAVKRIEATLKQFTPRSSRLQLSRSS